VPAAVHFVDIRQIGTELRPVCGSWSDDVTWTTIHSIVTCPLCARLVRGERPTRSVSSTGRAVAMGPILEPGPDAS
jgi:hypothetical protein